MKSKLWLGVLLILPCGCESMNNTEAGALGGGVLGGALGAIIGGRHPLAGAAIGAAAGTATGALVGNSEDRREARDARMAADMASRYPPLSLYDVAHMAQSHISDAVIINQIRYSNSVYNLTPDDITWLKQQGVSDSVVMEMQTRRPVIVPRGRPVYVVQPGPAW